MSKSIVSIVNKLIVENPGISQDNPELYFDSAMKYVKDRIDKMDMDDNPKLHVMSFSVGNQFVGRFAHKYPDSGFSPLLEQIPSAKVEVLEGVDHQFTNQGGFEMFLGFADKYLL